MVDYGHEHADSGDVYDITSLVETLIAPDATYQSGEISIEISSWRSGHDSKEFRHSISFSGHSGSPADATWKYIHKTSHLADVMNHCTPASDRVLDLEENVKKLKHKLKIAQDKVTAERMEQLASMRGARPVARLTTMSALLADGTLPALPAVVDSKPDRAATCTCGHANKELGDHHALNCPNYTAF